MSTCHPNNSNMTTHHAIDMLVGSFPDDRDAIKIAIIGTAGRRDDADNLSEEVYKKMCSIIAQILKEFHQFRPGVKIILVSGGAAWADHVAVHEYIFGATPIHLDLHFPAPFDSKYIPETSNFRDPGNVSNYYHRQFFQKTGSDSLAQIKIALNLGATSTVGNGFLDRNITVGQSDAIIAFTFGSKNTVTDQALDHQQAGLKDGGTAHTWDRSRARFFVHYNLNAFF